MTSQRTSTTTRARRAAAAPRTRRRPGTAPASGKRQILIPIAFAAAVAATVVAFVLIHGDDDGPGVLIGRTEAGEIPEGGGLPAAPSGAGDEEDDDELDDLGEFIAESGEPPDATFARLRIPKLGIDAGVSPRYVSQDVMPVPDGPAGVAWYDLSGWPGLGGRPGEGENAIFAGHVDYNGQIHYADRHYRGLGIFYYLNSLAPGDVVEVVYGGDVLRYEVTWVEQLSVASTNWHEIWSSDVGGDAITLFTCGGPFDPATQQYLDRFVVRAVRV